LVTIAHVAPAGTDPVALGGVLNAVTATVIALAGRGWDVELWHPHPWSDAFAEQIDALNAAGVHVVDLQAGGRRSWRAREVALVHLHSAFSPHLTRITSRLDRPYVLSPHGGYAPASLRRSHAQKAIYARVFERRMLRRAAAVCALTKEEADHVRRLAHRAQVTVIPNGVFAPARGLDPQAFRGELGLAATQPLAVFVGRLDVFHKGLDHLITAVAAAPGWHAALVGPPWRDGGAQLRDLISTSGAGDRIHIVAPRRGPAALGEVYAAADVFVLPSRWEGMPLSLLEALAHGLPALVSPPVEAAVPVAGAGAGWVAEPHELGRTLTAIAPDASGRRQRAARALAGRYSWERTAEALGTLYAAILESV
jgi:glycosyltransferase involved in cell wall biosynthesis